VRTMDVQGRSDPTQTRSPRKRQSQANCPRRRRLGKHQGAGARSKGEEKGATCATPLAVNETGGSSRARGNGLPAGLREQLDLQRVQRVRTVSVIPLPRCKAVG